MTPASVGVRGALAVALLACLAIVGCVRFWTTGADTLADLQAELHYKAVYAHQMARVHVTIQLFAPSSSKPGVCNSGGSKQGCYDADARLMQDFQAMLDALEATPVPPRYVAADELLRDAIAENVRGLELRNRAIAESDDAAWDEHKVVLDKATAMFQQAYLAFPSDNRPQPLPYAAAPNGAPSDG